MGLRYDFTFVRYKIPSFLSIPEKFELATSPLIQPPNPPTPTPTPTLVITFTSASNIPLALPPMVALGAGINSARACRLLGYPGVNQRVRNWLLLHLQQVQTVELEREREREREREQQEDKIEEKVGSSSSPKNRELGEVSEEPDLVVTDKIRGWVMMDYADTPNDLLPLLVECNYHWVDDLVFTPVLVASLLFLSFAFRITVLYTCIKQCKPKCDHGSYPPSPKLKWHNTSTSLYWAPQSALAGSAAIVNLISTSVKYA